MNITEYVNSQDIRTYWIEIGYAPSALESAWLIWQGKNHMVSEKHTSWVSIMNHSADCAIPAGSFDLPQESLHNFLRRYLEIENELIEAFYRNDEHAVYSYRMYFDDGGRDWCHEPALFGSFEEAYGHARDGGHPPSPNFVEFVKSYIGDEGRKIYARFNLDKEIVRVDEYNYLVNEKDYEIFQEVFRNMYFEFPTPFQKGDLVQTVRGLYTRPSYCGGTFVINSVEKAIQGFAVDSCGSVFLECIDGYMDLEYVRRPFTQEEQVLDLISKHLKDEIDLTVLLNEYQHACCSCEATRIRLMTNFLQK